MRRAQITTAVALILAAAALCVTLSRSPLSLAGTNGVTGAARLATTPGNSSACQSGEALPRGTTAIRLSLETVIGPWVRVRVSEHGRLLSAGSQTAGWAAGAVTVPVGRLARAAPAATVCFSLGPSYKVVSLLGEQSAPARAAVARGKPLAGRVRVEYLAPGRRSWWSRASSVVEHLGFGHAGSGAAIPALAAALAVAVIALTVWLVLGGLVANCWICALVALLNAACWSILTPPFQVPDEPAHFAYVQRLAQTGTLPSSAGERYSAEERAALSGLNSSAVTLEPQVPSLSSEAEQAELASNLSLALDRRGDGEAGVAASEPPLYYALATIPYGLGSSGTVLDRLALMRLLSAVLAGLTALFAFLFIRETLPSSPWSWTVGALGVALAPLLAEMSGGVNPDALLYAVSAALLYCLARAFRRGLTPRVAAAIGLATAVGLLTKVNFLGLIPGVIVALAVLTVRARRAGRDDAWRSLATASALALAPLAVYVAANLLSDRPAFGVVANALSSTRHAGSALDEISYVWQLYLPKLPGMHSDFPGLVTTRDIWFNGYVGLFGWLDTMFPDWVYTVALVPAALIGALCVRALLAGRGTLRARAGELTVYLALAAGLMALVGAGSYLAFVGAGGALFEPRYLLPLMPLLGAALALSARGAGRRWRPAAGAAIVVLLLAHDVFAQLQVIARYYG
ncbi:MAG TPA: DUF2142 domain-containing protein [Solirubrobacteraceae bacterium]|nr:DUF2142 domain-containing protein [Solirubrobacteraceae bacterium]